MYFRKSTLKNLSQGAWLEYVRKIRHMDIDDATDYFGFGGNYPHKTFNSYEINFDTVSYERIEYNVIVQNAINEWEKMRKREKTMKYQMKNILIEN